MGGLENLANCIKKKGYWNKTGGGGGVFFVYFYSSGVNSQKIHIYNFKTQ